MRHLNVGWGDLLTMPTFERRFYITTLSNEFTKKNELIEQAKNKSKMR